MTEAEKALLEKVLAGHGVALREDVHYHCPFREQADAVLRERMGSEYGESLKQLVFRAWDAMTAANEYEAKHPLGPVLYREFRKQWEQERGKR